MVDHPSFDDFYVLLEGHSLDEAASWAEGVRARIFSETGLRCSAGVARTKLLSLLATKRAKRPVVVPCPLRGAHALGRRACRRHARSGHRGHPPCERQAILEALGRDAQKSNYAKRSHACRASLQARRPWQRCRDSSRVWTTARA